MAVTSTYGGRIPEECSCGHPLMTVSPWDGSGWGTQCGHLVHLLLQVRGLTSLIFQTREGSGCPAMPVNLSHAQAISVLKIASTSGICLQDE